MGKSTPIIARDSEKPEPYLECISRHKRSPLGQAESSDHQGNNTELMGMLKSMRHEMQERDNQLKIQLQLRDEYMDAKLKRRDQNLEEALKQRDEEWRAELEKKGYITENSDKG